MERISDSVNYVREWKDRVNIYSFSCTGAWGSHLPARRAHAPAGAPSTGPLGGRASGGIFESLKAIQGVGVWGRGDLAPSVFKSGSIRCKNLTRINIE